MSNLAFELSNNIAAAVDVASPSVVRIDGRRRVSSTGIVWSADGTIIAANHTIHFDEGIEVAFANGDVMAARVVGRDPSTDLAVLRVERNDLTPLEWIDDAKVGHYTIAIGRPGRTARASAGIISAVGGEWRAGFGSKIDKYIEIDGGLPPGFSGGPLIDVSGRGIGLNTARLTRGANVVIPAQTLRRLVPQLLEHGAPVRPFLGIGVYPVHVTEQEIGLLVTSVKPNSAASAAGLILGDVVLAFNDRVVRYPGELHEALRDEELGSEGTLRILRGGERTEVAITLAPS